MSENINPLLFSATSSVFDNLSSAVLLPPQNSGAGTVQSSASSTTASNGSPAIAAATTAAATTAAATTATSTTATSTTATSTLPQFIPLNTNSPSMTASVPSGTSSNQNTSMFASNASNPVTLPIPVSLQSSFSTTSNTLNPGLPHIPNYTPVPPPSHPPSISPAITPSITPRLTPSVTPVPPGSNNSPQPVIPSTMFPAGPPKPPFGTGVTPPPPVSFVPTFGSGGPPPLPLGIGGPPLMPPSTIGLPPDVAQTPIMPPPVTATVPNTSTVTSATGGASIAGNSWAPPIYGVTPEQDAAAVLPPSFQKMAAGVDVGHLGRYRPVMPHWFFLVSSKPAVWKPFSFTDSINLEEAHRQGGCGLVSTDGGRYDIEVLSRVRRPVYWGSGPESSDIVRRCSWFRKTSIDAAAPLPYEEETAEKLEEAYRECVESGVWQRQVEVAGDCPGIVLLATPFSMQHYSSSLTPAFPTSISIAEGQTPDNVKRGADDFAVSDGEAEQVDHLLFLVHGIGPVCDLSFRSVEQCVDTFRDMGNQLVSTHYQQSVESGLVGRVEVLPVSWHKALHSEADGIDKRLKPITLRSIPMLREFTNDTILDVLLYTSPAYCQVIIDTVSSELNRLYRLFCHRHPNFHGGVSVAGHSLGSVILLDLLMHQKPKPQPPSKTESFDLGQHVDPSSAGPAHPVTDEPHSLKLSEAVKVAATDPDTSSEGVDERAASAGEDEDAGVEALQRRGVGSVITASTIRARRSQPDLLQSSLTSSVNFEMGTAGTGQPSIAYPQLLFQPQAAFLLGSPVAMFLTVRGLTQLSPQYHLPTCPHVFNIFHPYDPVAYRLETLINPHLTDLRPVLVPHHKGRKRMHLELKDTLERVGSDIKHRIVDSIQATWNKLYYLYTGESTEQQQEEMEQTVEQQLGALSMEGRSSPSTATEDQQQVEIGQLNAGRRIDYVLQEKPYESFTEYIFALQAHLSYWKSEDTLLLILKEIYDSMGISSDVKVCQAASLSSIPSTPLKTSTTVMPSTTFRDNYYSSGSNSVCNSPDTGPPAVIPMMAPQEADVDASGSQIPIPPIAAVAPLPPPMEPVAAPMAPSAAGGVTAPVRVLGGRPVMDPAALPPGMDPTAEPQSASSALPPPPTGTKINFSRKSALKR